MDGSIQTAARRRARGQPTCARLQAASSCRIPSTIQTRSSGSPPQPTRLVSGVISIPHAAVLLPAPIVEYILVHELVHLVEPNHTPDFWRKLEWTMPDFGARKQWLAAQGGCFASF